MPNWNEVIEAVCSIADSQIWRFILPLVVAAVAKTCQRFTRLGKRQRLLAGIINEAQLQPFLAKAKSVLGTLDNNLRREFISILTVEVERRISPFQFMPSFYHPRVNLYRLRVEAQYLERMRNLLRDSTIRLIIHNLVDELCLLLDIFRRIQLTRNEVGRYPQLRKKYRAAITELLGSKQQVRQQIQRLVADYAEQDLDSHLSTETELQSMDMEEFQDRCSRYKDYREIVTPKRGVH